jgi:hypothetical protein
MGGYGIQYQHCTKWSALRESGTGGIGNNDANLLLTVSYSATVQCRNRGGQIVDVKTEQTTSSGSDSDTRVRNGQLTVSPVSSTGPTDAQFEQGLREPSWMQTLGCA